MAHRLVHQRHEHGPQREVEILHDQLLHLLATLPGLQPRDITVMAPDIGAYGGLINAVFARSRQDPRHIPFSIADRDASAANPVTTETTFARRNSAASSGPAGNMASSAG